MMGALELLNKEISDLKIGERLIKHNVREDIYHKSIGVGSSLMREAFKSMAHYKTAIEEPRHETPEMMIGSAVHTLVLEPDYFDARVIKLPEGIVRGVSKKYTEFAAQNPDKLHLKQEELDQVTRLHAAITAQAGDWFVGGEPEKSYWFKHSSGLVLKARIDYQVGDGAIDLKTTRHDTQGLFERAVKYDYAVQDAHYQLVTELADMVYLGVCKKGAHQCFAVRQGDDVRQKTAAKLESVIKQIAFAKELDDYPFPPLTIGVTELMKWEQ